MTEPRRYSSDEVEEIFARAAERLDADGGPAIGSGDGLTLEELQTIGREVGLPPALVADAAGALDRTGTGGYDRVLGLPLTVTHSVPLPRPLDAAEWSQLVAQLRSTFRAAGRIREYGDTREWYNGNLHAVVEPTGTGYRLRMGTTKGRSRALFGGGAAALAGAGVLAAVQLVAPDADIPTLIGLISAGGVGSLVVGAVPLPTWARRRRRQMEGVAEWLTGQLEAGERPE